MSGHFTNQFDRLRTVGPLISLCQFSLPSQVIKKAGLTLKQGKIYIPSKYYISMII